MGATAQRPRVKVPKSAKKGDVFQIKTMVKHKMENGMRKGKDGKVIPRDIVNKFVCSFNGAPVLTMHMDTAVSANPYVAFYQKATESGEFTFAWTTDNGETVTASKTIQVG